MKLSHTTAFTDTLGGCVFIVICVHANFDFLLDFLSNLLLKTVTAFKSQRVSQSPSAVVRPASFLLKTDALRIQSLEQGKIQGRGV